jgi:hypothetical protein
MAAGVSGINISRYTCGLLLMVLLTSLY